VSTANCQRKIPYAPDLKKRINNHMIFTEKLTNSGAYGIKTEIPSYIRLRDFYKRGFQSWAKKIKSNLFAYPQKLR